MNTEFRLPDKTREKLSEEIASKKEARLKELLGTFRVGFEFFPVLEAYGELAANLLVDAYDADEIDRETFMSQVEGLDGSIELLSKGMINVHGRAVTLYWEDKKTGEKKDLLPRFFEVGYADVPEDVHCWPKHPPKGGHRLGISVAEMKRVLEAPQGQTRFTRTYSARERRVVKTLMQGQSYKVMSQKTQVGGITGESNTLRSTRLIAATTPFLIDDVKKGKDETVIVTQGYDRNIPVHDDGDGPYVVLHPNRRPVLFMLKPELLKKGLIGFSVMEKEERSDLLRRHGALPQRTVRTVSRGKGFGDVTRAKVGVTEMEEPEDNSSENDEEIPEKPIEAEHVSPPVSA